MGFDIDYRYGVPCRELSFSALKQFPELLLDAVLVLSRANGSDVMLLFFLGDLVGGAAILFGRNSTQHITNQRCGKDAGRSKVFSVSVPDGACEASKLPNKPSGLNFGLLPPPFPLETDSPCHREMLE